MPTLKASNRNHGEYISGFVGGEGCFSVSFSRRSKFLLGWETKPSFCVGQNYDRAEVLYLMWQEFGCGFMRRDYSDKTLKYEVRSLDDLVTKVVPHFEKYPLLSSKHKDFLLFRKEICLLMRRDEHRNVKGLQKILTLAFRMNGSGKRKYSQKEIFDSACFQMKI